jgi:hypothetical protein
MSLSLSAERVPAAQVGSKRGDGDHDATVGLPERLTTVLRRRPVSRAIVRGTTTRAPFYSYAADVLCKIARMRFPGAQLRR